MDYAVEAWQGDVSHDLLDRTGWVASRADYVTWCTLPARQQPLVHRSIVQPPLQAAGSRLETWRVGRASLHLHRTPSGVAPAIREPHPIACSDHRRARTCARAQESTWEDRGTGYISVVDIDSGRRLLVEDEVSGHVLHDSRLWPSETYQLKGEGDKQKIIVWEDPESEQDWALSFQDRVARPRVWSCLRVCSRVSRALTSALALRDSARRTRAWRLAARSASGRIAWPHLLGVSAAARF